MFELCWIRRRDTEVFGSVGDTYLAQVRPFRAFLPLIVRDELTIRDEEPKEVRN
ncbi:BQ5605_C019g08958 [Microbotryum silenes-dioicae]|uniref:BQ5605_C019g08958 protein n=1 Tax=Microbotryum silenes-dioicae TaxID=796604 RepID=A0A2X0NU15_9BASI|nr:BQ5605_C019g08958 [Microbotryum silenes-dioicae]